MLIEVLISAVLVVMISVATFTGFQAADSTSANEHTRGTAIQLAAQDQERLRGMTTAELARLGTAGAVLKAENGQCVETVAAVYKYCTGTGSFAGTTYTGAVFTLNSSARFVSASNEQFTCESSAAASGNANYIQTTSSVSWTGIGKHQPVHQSSIIHEQPTGVEVKVAEQKQEPVNGAVVQLETNTSKYKAEQTTPISGCVLFAGLTAGETATVTVKKLGTNSWISPTDQTEPVEKATIVANTLTTLKYTLAEPGAVEVEFFNGANAIKSDTFVAYNSQLKPSSFFLGGAAQKSGAETSSHTIKLTGLYPFSTFTEGSWKPAPYSVYGGDCTKNSPEEVAKISTGLSATIEPGVTTKRTVELAPVTAKVYEGTEKEVKEGKTKVLTAEAVKVVNTGCSGSAENGTINNEHYLTPGLNAAGELEPKYLPYAANLELCISGKVGAKKFKYTKAFALNSSAGTSLGTIYMKTNGKESATGC